MTDVEVSCLVSEALRMVRAWNEVRSAAAEILARHDERESGMTLSDTGPVRLRLEQALAAAKPRLTAEELGAAATLGRLVDGAWAHEESRQAAATVLAALRRVAG